MTIGVVHCVVFGRAAIPRAVAGRKHAIGF
jgi:hypothetical protein